MRLGLKIISIVSLVFVVMLLLDGYLTIQRETKAFYRRMQDNAEILGHVTRLLVEEAWKHDGEKKALALVKKANETQQPLRIRWIRLDVPKEHALAPKAEVGLLKSMLKGRNVYLHPKARVRNKLLAYIPVDVGEAKLSGLEITVPVSTIKAHTRRTLIRTGVLIGLVCVSGVLTMLWVGIFLIGRPLRELRKKTRRIGAGDFTTMLELKGKDELSQLADDVNHMGRKIELFQKKIKDESEARIAMLEQLRHTERLSTLGRLSSGVAHELGTPLNIISGRAGLICRDVPEKQETCRNAQIIIEQTERMVVIIKQLLEYARRKTPLKKATQLQALVKQSAELIAPLAKKNQVKIHYVPGETPPEIQVDPLQIQQVITNIMLNGIQAMPDGGTLSLELFSTQDDGREAVTLAVRDEGQGITKEDLDHIFDPFFTTKDVGKGTGLGLSIVYGIIRDHGGRIEVDSTPGQGSTFTVIIPREGRSA